MAAARPPRHGLARVLSKRGHCSRAQAERLVREGRVRVAGRVCRDPEWPTHREAVDIVVDGQPLARAERVVVALNKPRGLVTSRSDEQGRPTVYQCLDDPGLPWLAPVGRLDRASEGLLLFCNDPDWAAAVADPARGPGKTYHVQIDGAGDDGLLAALRRGVDEGGEWLAAQRIERLRSGTRSCWLAIELHGGRNRQIRRMLAAHGRTVQRLVRVAIGPLALGDLAKGQWRRLAPAEVAALLESPRPIEGRGRPAPGR